jgi:hypothetical protein
VKLPQFSSKIELENWKEGPLKKAWHAAAMSCHPDRNKDSKIKFQDVLSAYVCLSQIQVQPDEQQLIQILRKAGILDRNIVILKNNGKLESILNGSEDVWEHIPILQQQQRKGFFRQ